ncbi:MAG TPA: hypothetical protein VG326_11535 [Tepidisphaeraceae bacterium]|jgi:hypothetical protein|nr:hypothetical protein [Tepidisphaeraceae bacterium]
MQTKELVNFLKQNEELVKQIAAGSASIDTLWKQVEANRSQAKALLPVSGLKIQFFGSASQDIKVRQRDLIKQILDAAADTRKYQDQPDVQAGLWLRQAALYAALADTYDDTFAEFITFTQDQINKLDQLLNQAALDGAARQKQADVLNAAVQISKVVLSILGTVLK